MSSFAWSSGHFVDVLWEQRRPSDIGEKTVGQQVLRLLIACAEGHVSVRHRLASGFHSSADTLADSFDTRRANSRAEARVTLARQKLATLQDEAGVPDRCGPPGAVRTSVGNRSSLEIDPVLLLGSLAALNYPAHPPARPGSTAGSSVVPRRSGRVTNRRVRSK